MVFYTFRRFVNYLILSAIATCLAYVVASLALDPAAKYYGRNPQPSAQDRKSTRLNSSHWE